MRTTVTATPIRSLFAIAAVTLVLAGCAGNKPRESTSFDFGPAVPAAAPVQQAPAAMPAVVVMDATGPDALEGENMYYRLNYADALQARTYASSRWAGNQLQMLSQRIRTRLSQSGMKVLSATDASSGVPLLRLEVVDFVHAFSGVDESAGRLVLRASLFDDNRLLDQRSFTQTTPAPSADAAGGARALAASTDAIAAEIRAWLATADTSKR